MPEDVYMQHLRGSLTESSAGTLTTGEIKTGATVGGMVKGEAIACEFREIITQVGTGYPEDLPATGAIENVLFALSVLAGRTAVPTIAEVDCIYLRDYSLRAGVGTYLPLIMKEGAFPPAYNFPLPLLVPQSTIYEIIDSTNSGTAAVMYWRIGFTYVLLSGSQIIEALEVWRSTVS